MSESINKLSILTDSREPSVSLAKSFFEEAEPRQLGHVEHIRESTFADRLDVFLRNCGTNDHIFISVHYISESQLDRARRYLKQASISALQITVASYDCFTHIREWCEGIGCRFRPNFYKRRKLTHVSDSSHPNNITDLTRVWIQYRLMLAIISRTEMLGEVCRSLILGHALPGDDLQKEYLRAMRYFKLGEPDMAGGSYACENTLEPNSIDLLRDRLNKIAVTNFNVLVRGDSGTGKEVIAWAIHELSDRHDETFLTLNCAGLPDELLESEMFGYLKGAHNMAHEDHAGLLEQAAGGTLFLDELPEMSPRIQAKLLRFVESGEYRPLGSTQTRYADTRIIGAGQEKRLTGSKGIRPDLLSRINQVGIDVLPLRELESRCNGTIYKIAYVLLERFTWSFAYQNEEKHELSPCDIKEYQIKLRAIFSEHLTKHSWTDSNIRELQNFLRQWIVFGDGEFERLDTPIPSSCCSRQVLHDRKLTLYLREPKSRSELKTLAEKQPLRGLKKAYIRHLFMIYTKIVEIENQSRDIPRKPTQKEFAAIMNVSENTISLHLN